MSNEQEMKGTGEATNQKMVMPPVDFNKDDLVYMHNLFANLPIPGGASQTDGQNFINIMSHFRDICKAKLVVLGVQFEAPKP